MTSFRARRLSLLACSLAVIGCAAAAGHSALNPSEAASRLAQRDLGSFASWTRRHPPPHSKPASFFLSPKGSDGNPCTRKAPCRSFNRGYHVARPGQVVQVAAGDYGTQTVLYDSRKEGAARNVVIRPAKKAAVTIGDLKIGPSRFTKGATHLTVMSMTLTGDIAVNGCGAPDGQQCSRQSGGNYLRLYNLDVRGQYGFSCSSCDHVSLSNSRIGPLVYGSPCNGSAHPEVQNAYDAITGLKLKRSHDLLFDGDIFENFSRCTRSDHTECLQVEPGDDITIRNSIFRRCDTMVLAFFISLAGDSRSAAGYHAPNHVLIENNFFDEASDHAGGPTYFALNLGECTNCTIRYNSWLQEPRMPTGEISLNNKFIGNLGPMSQYNCYRNGVTYSHNVWQGAKCGSTDRRVANLGFVNPTPKHFDLHLRRTSPAINRGGRLPGFPRRDIDGQRRPKGPALDAGADEAR